jgi:hypothetical protein
MFEKAQIQFVQEYETKSIYYEPFFFGFSYVATSNAFALFSSNGVNFAS